MVFCGENSGNLLNDNVPPRFCQTDVMHSVCYSASLNTISFASIKFAGLFGSFTCTF